jgi:hypothetical protein
LHGIGTTIRTCSFSTTTFMSILILVFNNLSAVHPKTLSTDQSWVAVTMKVSNLTSIMHPIFIN